MPEKKMGKYMDDEFIDGSAWFICMDLYTERLFVSDGDMHRDHEILACFNSYPEARRALDVFTDRKNGWGDVFAARKRSKAAARCIMRLILSE